MSHFLGFSVILVILMWLDEVSCVTEDEIHCAIYHCGDRRCKNTLQTDNLFNLDITYNCSVPFDVSIVPPSLNKTGPFRLFHSNLCITSLPKDLCDYPNIVSIEVVNSSLMNVPNLSCLKNLTHLDLSYNEVNILRNDTFSGLTKLRNIDIRYNMINSVEGGTFKEDLHGLMYVKLDGNHLSTAEAWPMRIGHPFCLFGLSHNKITRFSNADGWQIDPFKKYGPGWYDLSNNLFSTWITEQLKIFGINEVHMLGYLIEWVFDLRRNPWICDCEFYLFLKVSSNYPDLVRSDHFNLFCDSPSHLNGTRVLDVPLDKFVCNITKECSPECLCQDQPAKGHIVVDCRGRTLTELPDELPHGKLTLLLSENVIKNLEYRPYLRRVIHMDLSRNGLEYVANEALDALPRRDIEIDLSHNNLKYLPRSIQDIFIVNIDNNPFICDCNSTWMARWMNLRLKDHDVSSVTCSVPSRGTLVKVIQADDSFLQCPPYQLTIILGCVVGSVTVVSVIIIIILIVFRYEVTVLVNSFQRNRQTQDVDDFEHDVFISLNEENEADRLWVIQNILPGLEVINHLNVYFPPRDTIPGSVEADEITKALKKSRTALIVLSKRYLESPQKIFEFSMAYDDKVRSKRGRLLIVKFPDVTELNRGYLKAFIRLGKYINANDENCMQNVLKSLKKDHGEKINNIALINIYANRL